MAPVAQRARRIVARAIYNDSPAQPDGVRGLVARGHQELFERGVRPPWVLSRDACHEFWRTASGLNDPARYAAKRDAIIGFLDRFWQPQVTPDLRILEVGCNAGANLNGLARRGYSDLRGVEINADAVGVMRSSFPGLANTPVELGPFEAILPRLDADSVDVVFSMAVLLHVHPSSNHVFADMVRLAKRYICTIEAEGTTVSYIFARNYRRVFERLGCTQVRSVLLTRDAFPEVGENYWGYTARLFDVP